MERYHFWLSAFDTQFFGCQQDCGRVIHCRVDAQELRIQLEPAGSLDLYDELADLPCDQPQAELTGRLRLPLSAIAAVTLEPEAARRGLGGPCAVRLELDRDLWRPSGVMSHSLYLAALDPLDEQLEMDRAETTVLYTALTTLAAGRKPYHVDPNPYHRAFARLGWPALAQRRQWDPAASPRSLSRQPLVQLAQAYVRFRQFNAFFWPIAAFLTVLAWSLARYAQGVGLLAVTLLLAGLTLTWMMLSWQAHDRTSRPGGPRGDD